MKYLFKLVIASLLSSAVLSAPTLKASNRFFSSIGINDLLASATGEATSSAGATEDVGLASGSAPEGGATGGSATRGAAVSFGVTSDVFGSGETPSLQNFGGILTGTI